MVFHHAAEASGQYRPTTKGKGRMMEQQGDFGGIKRQAG
jgi:hypothetical protein